MIKTIFRNTFLVGITVLVLCALLFFGVQYTQTKDETYDALRQEAAYAEQGLMLNGTDYLDQLDDVNRITWIDAEGNVLYDSQFPLPIANQKEFKEVQEAIEDGSGQGIRKSLDSGESTMYYAVKCSDGTILCLSRPMSAVRYALVAVSPVLWILVIVVIISGVLSYRAARQIVKPINEIDLDRPDMNAYPEINPLIEKIQEQKLTIQEEAAGREEMRREFTANVSHELKTPLTSISGFAELMAQGAVSQDKVQEFSADIYKESQRLMALIDDIMKLSQLDEEEGLPQMEEVDLYEIAQDVADSLHPVAEKAEVNLSITGEPANIRGVYRLLHEMVYNLCDNAIKYNYPGGRVDVSVESSVREVVLTVADTGIGIPAEHQKRVFERFYRVDKSHSKEIGGTGLGLSIVKHAAQYHGANVELESEEGAGTTVRLRFPVAS